MPADDDDNALLAVLPVRRCDSVRVSFERSPRTHEKTPGQGIPWGPSGVTTAYRHFCSCGVCACTHLESSDPALRRRILALHVVHVRRFVLALVIEPTAE